jgi:triacylglycerol lipase
LWLDLLPAILDQQSAARSLWFTGHSLGAALATLAVARSLERGLPVNGLYDYGSPRCGDRDFAIAFNAKFDQAYRFVYSHEVVTRVPLRLFGYRHVGDVKYIDSNCQITGELGGWAAYLREVDYSMDELRQLNVPGIADHDIANYVRCLGGQPGVNPVP